MSQILAFMCLNVDGLTVNALLSSSITKKWLSLIARSDDAPDF